MSHGRQALALSAVLAGCGWTSVFHTAPRGIEERPHHVHQGAGFAVRVLDGSVVKATKDTVSVDASDGSAWLDVRWIDTTNPIVPIAEANRWAEHACMSVHWDLPFEPTRATWIAGGRCTIEGREHWTIAVVEQFERHALLTAIMGVPGALTHEDLWVELLGSALSVNAGSTPSEWISPVELRRRLRAIDAGNPNALLPIPGGGVFSGLVAQALADVWTARRAVRVPDTFDGSAAEVADTDAGQGTAP